MLHTSRMNTLEMHASPDNPLVTTLRELGACPDLGSVIEILRRTVRSLIGADGVTVVLRDGASCHYIEEEAIGPLWKGQRFPMEACISGLAMMRGEQIAIADVYEDERVPHDAYRPTFVRALAMTPIATREVIGALGVYWATRHVATAEETYRLGAVSAAAATAIENLRLLEQLRLEARQKDEFLAMLAHELRNPLAPMRNAAYLLQGHPGDVPTVREATQLLQRQLEHLVRLVDDLVDLSRAGLGKIELRRAPVDLREVLRSALETATPVIEAFGHELSLSLPAAPVEIDGDAMRLGQAIANLLNNAAKYSPPAGTISLALAHRGDVAQISVTDNGEGIAPEMLERIFDLFVQGEPSGNRVNSGLGIGLTLVRRLVELHGGTVRAASAGKGQGSRFTIELPCKR